jgi:arsenical-resistance protein 2
MSEAPWWAAFGEPQAAAPPMDPAVIAEKLAAQPLGPDQKRDFLLVDVRRTDFEGGTVATSINFPAHSFFQTRAIVYQLCKQAGIKQVVFYCSAWASPPISTSVTDTHSVLQWPRSSLRWLDARLS